MNSAHNTLIATSDNPLITADDLAMVLRSSPDIFAESDENGKVIIDMKNHTDAVRAHIIGVLKHYAYSVEA